MAESRDSIYSTSFYARFFLDTMEKYIVET